MLSFAALRLVQEVRPRFFGTGSRVPMDWAAARLSNRGRQSLNTERAWTCDVSQRVAIVQTGTPRGGGVKVT